MSRCIPIRSLGVVYGEEWRRNLLESILHLSLAGSFALNEKVARALRCRALIFEGPEIVTLGRAPMIRASPKPPSLAPAVTIRSHESIAIDCEEPEKSPEWVITVPPLPNEGSGMPPGR